VSQAITILYEDEHMLAVEKPAGLLVYPLENDAREETLVDILRPKLNFNNPTERSGIVHRLDRETSGILLVAKDEKTETMLKKEFKERNVKKIYSTLVQGRIEPKKGEIKIPLGRASKDRLRVVPSPDGRESHTLYEVERYFPKDDTSLVRAELKTGRTHQIRVHFSAIGHPVVGDKKYSSGASGLDRQFLHATEIEFVHPYTKKTVKVKSALPSDLKQYLSKLS
jgi:23S rRNA pseudouridine1911/1915/1917 synthase